MCNPFIGFASANIRHFFILAKLLQKKFKKIIFVAMILRFFIAITALFSLSVGRISAQLRFDALSHDFGTIAEDGGSVECLFRCRNTSTTPIVIVAARTSCGCTKVEFSRKPIPADSTATLRVTFNPMNYPGAFARKIAIATSEGNLKEQLLIKGVVTPRHRTIEERYPIVMGEGLRVATNAHIFGYIEHGRAKQSTFEVANTSDRKVELRIDNPHPELTFYHPTTLAPHEEATINFECALGEEYGKYGTLSYTINMYIDGKAARHPLIIGATAIDLRPAKRNNEEPTIVLSKKFINFGAINIDASPRSEKLLVSNDGKEPLIIRHIESDGGYFAVSVEGSNRIEGGESRTLRVSINPSKLPFGAVVDRVRIVSNAPSQPVITLRVSAIVEK